METYVDRCKWVDYNLMLVDWNSTSGLIKCLSLFFFFIPLNRACKHTSVCLHAVSMCQCQCMFTLTLAVRAALLRKILCANSLLMFIASIPPDLCDVTHSRRHLRLLEPPLTALQFAVVPGQATVWVGVAPRAVLVPVRVPAVVLLQPYMGYCGVRILTVKHINIQIFILRLWCYTHSPSVLSLPQNPGFSTVQWICLCWAYQ